MAHHISVRAMSTLPIVLSAISHFHSKFHFPSPTSSRAISRALEGAKRSFGTPSVSAKFFTADHLYIIASCQQAHMFSCFLENSLENFYRVFWPSSV